METSGRYPPIKNGFLTFAGGLIRPCELEIAIDLDRRIGYRITLCNDGLYDADAWTKAAAVANRTFTEKVKDTLFKVAVQTVSVSTTQQQALVCSANAVWQAPAGQLNPTPSADGISYLIIRNGTDMRVEGGFRLYSPEGLALARQIEHLAGS